MASLSLALESPFPARKRVILLSAPYERRAPMIAFTYVASSVLLTGSGALFAHGTISATQQTFFWRIIFFFASAAASSAYLPVHWKFLRLRFRSSTRSELESAASPDRGYSAH